MIIQITIALIVTSAIVTFCCLDLKAYCAAKYPERSTKWYYKLPGGGIAALIKFGFDKTP